MSLIKDMVALYGNHYVAMTVLIAVLTIITLLKKDKAVIVIFQILFAAPICIAVLAFDINVPAKVLVFQMFISVSALVIGFIDELYDAFVDEETLEDVIA